MLISDKVTQERVINFTKYARFVSEKFGVTVNFDGIKAQTNGTEITLPNIAGMSDREVDFLYCILLHEVGHIRYSTFTKEAFSQIKSDSHFLICNAIEDARIENLLIRDFDGANAIFEKLYNHFAMDKSFWKKIFGFNPKDYDLFRGVVTYIHYRILKLKNKLSYEEVLGKSAFKKVSLFVQENKIEKIIDEHPLKNWEDVIALSNKIYNIFFKEKKDKSSKNNIAEVETTIHDLLEDTLKNIEEKNQNQLKNIKDLSSEASKLKQDIEQIKNEKKSVLDELNGKRNQLEEQLSQIERALFYREEVQAREEKTKSVTERISKKNSTLQKLEEKINSIKAKSEKSTGDDEKINRLTKRLEENKKIVDKYQKRLEKNDELKNDFAEELNGVPEEIKTASEEDLNKILNDLYKEEDSVRSEINKQESEIFSKADDLKKIQDKIRAEKENFTSKITKSLKEIQESINSSGIPINVIPQFEKTPGWEEADEVQMDFDESASQKSGEIVVNGVSAFSKTSQRDILTVVNDLKQNLQEFDIAEHFKTTHNVSKLDDFNEISQITNTTSSEGEIYSSNRRHIPLTTQFDVIRNEVHSNEKELIKIRKSNGIILNQIKNLFKSKLKFQKKSRFKGGQEEGSLDQRSLWKLATKTDDSYYEISVPRFINSVSASIAIDVSGSMDKDYTAHGQKLRELTLFLSDALQDCHVRHEICGYHAPVSHEMRTIKKSSSYNRTSNILETIVFKGFNDKQNSGIQNIKINCTDNCDGENLRVISTRLQKERGKRKIMFIVTDGKPFLSDSDVKVLDQDLKDTISWCRRNKVEVFAFGFNEQAREFYGENFCHITDYSDILKFIQEKL